jgi:hypothetical protein
MSTRYFLAIGAVATACLFTSTANAQFNFVSRTSRVGIASIGGVNYTTFNGPGLWVSGLAFNTSVNPAQTSNVTNDTISINAYSETVNSGQSTGTSFSTMTVVFNIIDPTQVHIEMSASNGTPTADGWIATLTSPAQTVALPTGTGLVTGSFDTTLSPGQWTFNFRTNSPSHVLYSITAVPSPAAAGLLGLGCSAAFRRRRAR